MFTKRTLIFTSDKPSLKPVDPLNEIAWALFYAIDEGYGSFDATIMTVTLVWIVCSYSGTDKIKFVFPSQNTGHQFT